MILGQLRMGARQAKNEPLSVPNNSNNVGRVYMTIHFCRKLFANARSADWFCLVFPTMRTGFIRLYTFAGGSVPMPEELMELYNLYQQELHTRQVLKIIKRAICRCRCRPKTEIWPFLPFFLVIK